MSLLSVITHLATQVRAAHRRYVTERQVGALPFEIRKDIGWPPVTGGPTR